MGDEEVVRRVRDGDGEAYRILVERYAPLVFAVVRRYCDEPSDAEDLAQEIFVRAYEGLDGFRGDASFGSWLYRIAVNRCRDQVRDPRREERSLQALEESAGGGGAAVSGAVPTPAQELERSERAQSLRRALGELAPDYAVPFLLKYEQGLSYREMARMLGSTEGALKVRVHRARVELRRLLEDWR